MVAARTTTTRGRRPHKARTLLTYSVPGGASRAAESISLRALRVATPRACAPAVDAVAHTPELVAQVFAVLRHDLGVVPALQGRSSRAACDCSNDDSLLSLSASHFFAKP